MAEITVQVYDGTAPGTLIVTLENATGRQWLTQLNDAGSGSLKVHADDTIEVAACAYGNIVRFLLDGIPRCAFIIERREIPLASEGETVEKEWSVSGRGVLALLEDAIVYPEAWSEGSLSWQRPFDWTAIVYDDASWIAATQVQRQDAVGGTVPDWNTFPIEWPDPLAYWIWSRAQSSPTWTPAGTSYFRKTFTLGVATAVLVFVTCDNNFRLSVDSQVVVEEVVRGPRWAETYRADIFLGPGDHQIAVEAINYNNAADDTASPAGLLVSLTENANGVAGTVITRSDSSWVCLDYPTDVPGMSVGTILRLLVEEAQARGALEGITLGFTDTLDSNLAAWTSEPDISLDVGTNLLNVIETFHEQFVDVEMTPTLELRVYNKGTLGSDLTGSVSLAVGADFEALQTRGQDLITNAILARDATGALTAREDAGSLATFKRTETYLELATAPNPPRARAMADEVFLDYSHPTVEISAKVTEGSGPYAEWKPGDTILVPNQQGAAAETSILSIAVEEDDAGYPIYHAEGAQDATS